MEIKIQKLYPEAAIPQYKTSGSAGFDFALIEDIQIPARSTVKVRTGLALAVPQGYFLAIISRSSGPLKTGTTMANGVGIIDSDYAGPADEIFILAENITDQSVELKKGDRIAQGLILPVVQVTFTESNLTAPNRGGHGSTGK